LDQSEKVAEQFLHSLKLGKVVYEPCGNVPPDFSVGDGIAVEVRRLNQIFTVGHRLRGLEEVSIPLRHRVKALLPSLGPAVGTKSWFVYYSFRRPLPPWKDLEASVLEFLRAFKDGRSTDPVISIGTNFRVDLIPTTTPHPYCFLFGGYGDHDAGGWIVEELIRNLEICIAQKTRKTASFRNSYREWWLVFVDHIAYGTLSARDLVMIRESLKGTDTWDKIFLLDPTSLLAQELLATQC
jgi:hypothetical protein